MRRRRLVAAAQFAVTGERLPRRLLLLAEEVRRGPHAFVLDLGCGSAPLLDFVEPERYVGVEDHAGAIASARERHARPGYEFVEADLVDVSYAAWRGADVVVLSSVAHHLPADDLLRLLARIVAEVEPQRLLLQDAEATGPFGPLVRALDDGRHLRPKQRLIELLEPGFGVRVLWTYDNPLRSFHQFLLELAPR